MKLITVDVGATLLYQNSIVDESVAAKDMFDAEYVSELLPSKYSLAALFKLATRKSIELVLGPKSCQSDARPVASTALACQ
jgi:hypothetical protein